MSDNIRYESYGWILTIGFNPSDGVILSWMTEKAPHLVTWQVPAR